MLSNKVSGIMTREVITAEASTAIFSAMAMMAQKNVGAVIITEDRTPIGIFTERDVLKRVASKKLDAKKSPVKRVMTAPIRSVRQDTHIVEALGRMIRGKFRHLLVLSEKGSILGIISMRDILRLAVELGKDLVDSRTVGSVMSRKIVTVDGSVSIHETLEIMIKKNTPSVVIVEKGKPEGIFTERDVLKRVAIEPIDTRKTPIRKVMTPEIVSMAHSAPTGEVLAEMYRRGFRHMPIKGEGGELVGIVSMPEILQYARALDVDERVRRAWKEVEEFWEAEEHYTPG